MIYDEANVDILEDSFRNDVVEVCFHVLEEQINVFVIVGADGVIEFNDVRVFQLLQDLYFSKGTLGVSGMLKGIEDLFESEYSFGGFFLYLPDVAIGSRAHFLKYGEAFEDVTFDIGRVVLRHKSNVSKLNGS